MNARDAHRSQTNRLLPALALLTLWCSPSAPIHAQNATSEKPRPIVVAIVGAIQAEPAVYELAVGSTVEDAIRRVGGLRADATGQVAVLRGQGVRQLFQDTNRSLMLQDGDAIRFNSSMKQEGSDRSIVLLSRYGRPIVSRLPLLDLTGPALAAKLGVSNPRQIQTIPPVSQSDIVDGVFVIADTIDQGFWQWLASSLPPIPRAATVSYANAPMTVSPAPVVVAPTHRPQAVDISEAIGDMTSSDLTELTEPAPLPPLGEAEDRNFASIATVTPRQPVTTRVPESIFGYVESGTSAAPSASLTESPHIAEPPVDVTETSGPMVAGLGSLESFNETAPESFSSTAFTTPAPAPTLASKNSAAAGAIGADSFGLIAMAAGVVLVVGGVYLLFQTSSSDASSSMLEAGDAGSRNGAGDVVDAAIVQEEAVIEMPASIQGQAVALGKIRIDAAHDGPSGPHFGPGARSQTRRRTVANASTGRGDVLGRVLAAMDQERSE